LLQRLRNEAFRAGIAAQRLQQRGERRRARPQESL